MIDHLKFNLDYNRKNLNYFLFINVHILQY